MEVPGGETEPYEVLTFDKQARRASLPSKTEAGLPAAWR
jgi:hypothetical protein